MISRLLSPLLCILAALCPPASAGPSGQETTVNSTMPRAEFKRVIGHGPQRFIASLQVEPFSLKGRFVGFKIVGHTPESPIAHSPNIQVGDVVLSVNGHSLERPDQFMQAWEAIQRAKILEVRVLRGKSRLRYRWTFLP